MFMQEIEATQHKSALEAARVAAMSPAEQHRYWRRKRRQLQRYEWYKTLTLVVSFFGTVFFIFALFFFFE